MQVDEQLERVVVVSLADSLLDFLLDLGLALLSVTIRSALRVSNSIKLASAE